MIPKQTQNIVLILFACAGCSATTVKIDHEPTPYRMTNKSVILPGNTAIEFTQLCSRDPAPRFDSTWEPDENIIGKMESDFKKIAGVEATSCCTTGVKIKNPESYYRQYVGIVVNKRQLVYINAFLKPNSHEWTEAPSSGGSLVCDGGLGYWGVLYDPATGEFFDLAINGQS